MPDPGIRYEYRPLLTHQNDSLIICHECDLLQRIPDVPPGWRARCGRCTGMLYRHIPDSIDRTLALAIAGLTLFVVANVFPFMELQIGAQSSHTVLITGVLELYAQGMWTIALVVLFTCVLAPLAQLLFMIHVFLPLKLGRRPGNAHLSVRGLHHLREWNMVEVFLLGILVAAVKLAGMSTIVPGIAMWSFIAMILMITGAISSIDRHVLWQRLGQVR